MLSLFQKFLPHNDIFFFFQNRQLCKEYKTLKQAWLKKIERNENNPKRKLVHYQLACLVRLYLACESNVYFF